MTAKVLESLGGKFVDQWAATLLTPAFLFWLGGLGTAVHRWGWPYLLSRFTHQPEPTQISLLVGALCLVAASAFAVQRFDLAVLRFLEGYWPRWLMPLRRWRIAAYRQHQAKLTQQRHHLRAQEDERRDTCRALKAKVETQGSTALTPDEKERYLQLSEQLLTPDERLKLIQLQQQLRALPAAPDLMPTQLGNLLRAAERRPIQKYGLDAVICWPRYWLLLPEATQTHLKQARADLNSAARLWLWSLLFLLWAAFGAWWALPMGLLTAGFAYFVWANAAATTYGDLIEAAYDLHRFKLYEALHWPLPTNPAEEQQLGQALTAYLWQGSDQPHPTFVHPKPEA
jgi:hypothetical protein